MRNRSGSLPRAILIPLSARRPRVLGCRRFRWTPEWRNGRRIGLKIRWRVTSVWVRIPPRAFPKSVKATTMITAKELKDKIILVTGGCGDIGRAVTKKLTEHGATVVLCDLLEEPEAMSRVAHLHLPAQQWLYINADVTNRPQVDRMIDAIFQRFGRLDVACANAGIVEGIPFLEYPVENWNRMLHINLTGCFHIGQSAARAMLRHKKPGQILFTTSWVADVPWPEITPYCVSKAGVKMLMKGMARELTKHGVRVNAIAPGIVNAGMARHQYDNDPGYRARADKVIPIGFMQPLESVAEAFRFLCSDASGYMTGSTLLVDGGCSLFQFD